MTDFRVVVIKEGRVWVAQALESDMAAQASLDEPPTVAVACLGDLFDSYDSMMQTEGSRVSLPIVPAPKVYSDMYDFGEELGELRLGVNRIADVRVFHGDPNEFAKQVR